MDVCDLEWVWLAGIAMVVGAGGCATPSESSGSEQPEETTTESSVDSMANVQTVRSKSKQRARERDRVSGVIERHSHVLEACNLRSLAVEERSRRDQEITFAWSIDQSGTPRDVRVVDNQLEGTGIAHCVAGEVRRMTFPSPESESIEVEYPIQFREGETEGTNDWYERMHTVFRDSWEPPKAMRPDDGAEDQSSARDEEGADRPEMPEALRRRVEKTIVFIDVAPSGEVESVEFLRRPDDDEFVRTVQEGIEATNGNAERRWPMPRRPALRERVAETGIILHNWLPSEEHDPGDASERDSSEETEER